MSYAFIFKTYTLTRNIFQCLVLSLTFTEHRYVLSCLHFFLYGATRWQMKNTDIACVSPTFQACTKSTGRALDQVHDLRVLHRRDVHIFSLLPATWAIIYNLNNSGQHILFLQQLQCIQKGDPVWHPWNHPMNLSYFNKDKSSSCSDIPTLYPSVLSNNVST